MAIFNPEVHPRSNLSVPEPEEQQLKLLLGPSAVGHRQQKIEGKKKQKQERCFKE